MRERREGKGSLLSVEEERGVLVEIGGMLVREKLITPKEQLRFLSLLKEEG